MTKDTMQPPKPETVVTCQSCAATIPYREIDPFYAKSCGLGSCVWKVANTKDTK